MQKTKSVSFLLRIPPSYPISDPVITNINVSSKIKISKPSSSLFTISVRNITSDSAIPPENPTESNAIREDFRRRVKNQCKLDQISLSDAEWYIDKLVQTEPLPSTITFNHILAAISRKKLYTAVFFLYHKMRVHQITPDFFTLNVLMDCSSCLREMRYSWCVLSEIIKRGFEIGSVTQSSLVKGLFLSGEAEKALQLFDKMSQQGIEAKTFTYGMLMNVLYKAHKRSLVIELFDRMLKTKGEANAYTYSLAIRVYCKEKRMTEAINLFDEMVGKGISPDVVPYPSRKRINAFRRRDALSKS